MKTTQSISLAVTSDIVYDQRMLRICTSLSKAGYQVYIYSRTGVDCQYSFSVTPIRCKSKKGVLGYAEYNLRLLKVLWYDRSDVFVAIDLDTILPMYLISKIRKKVIVYDAHEYFVESPEIQGRWLVKLIWRLIARLTVPRIKYKYTVNKPIGELMTKRYGGNFGVIKNVPYRSMTSTGIKVDYDNVILYQGVLNVGRGLEEMIAAMDLLPWAQLWIAGKGDVADQLKEQVANSPSKSRIRFLGQLSPTDLTTITRQAWLGLNLLDTGNINYRYSLANKFFDYMQAHVPCLSMNTPVYKMFNGDIKTAVLIDELASDAIVDAVVDLYSDKEKYNLLVANNKKAASIHHWENEEQKLLTIYRDIFNSTQ